MSKTASDLLDFKVGDKVRLVNRPKKSWFPKDDKNCNSVKFKRCIEVNHILIDATRGSVGTVREVDRKRKMLLIEFDQPCLLVAGIPFGCCKKTRKKKNG